MDLIASLARFLGLAAFALDKRGEARDVAAVLRYVSKGILVFGDDLSSLKALNRIVLRKVSAGESFSTADFARLFGDMDALTDRADAAARQRGLNTSSQLSPVGDLGVDEAVQVVETLGETDLETLKMIRLQDGRQRVRDAARARLADYGPWDSDS